ncbi:MAG: RING finger domain-containing protein [Candidatus Heimdallarchaeota archaeon]
MSDYSGRPPRRDRLQRRAARHHMRRPPAYSHRPWEPGMPRRPPPVFHKPWYQRGFAKIIIMLLIVSLFLPVGTISLWILILLVVIYFFTRRRQDTPRRPPPYPPQRQLPPERYPAYPPRQQPAPQTLPASQSRTSPGAIPTGQQSRQRIAPVFIYPERPQYVSSAKLTCFSCGEPYDPEHKFCTECGKPISRCKICRGVVGFGDTLSQCPHCQNEFHYEHVREWLKVSGDCPVCRQRIREAELITKAMPMAKT